MELLPAGSAGLGLRVGFDDERIQIGDLIAAKVINIAIRIVALFPVLVLHRHIAARGNKVTVGNERADRCDLRRLWTFYRH